MRPAPRLSKPYRRNFKEATSQTTHLEKFSLHFQPRRWQFHKSESSSIFIIIIIIYFICHNKKRSMYNYNNFDRVRRPPKNRQANRGGHLIVNILSYPWSFWFNFTSSIFFYFSKVLWFIARFLSILDDFVHRKKMPCISWHCNNLRSRSTT